MCMCMYMYIHMTSKNISITEDVYLSEVEEKEIWAELSNRKARTWNKSNLEDFK